MFVLRLLAILVASVGAAAASADVPTVQVRVEQLAATGLTAQLALRIDLPSGAELAGFALDVVVDGHDGGIPSHWELAALDAALSNVGQARSTLRARRERVQLEAIFAEREAAGWVGAVAGGSTRVATGRVSIATRHVDVPIVVRVERALVNVLVDGRVVAADVANCIGWSPGVSGRAAARGLRSSPGLAPFRLPPRSGDALHGLTPEQQRRFAVGRERFEHHFLENEGGGPAFNDDACVACHKSPAAGGSDARTVTRFARAEGGFDSLEHLGGPLHQFQAHHPGAEESIPSAADVAILRLTPPLFGSGLIEALDDATIEVVAAGQDESVAGRVHWTEPFEGGALRVGRFGWKCQIATLTSFTGDALLFEMGLTNRLFADETAPNGNASVLARHDHVDDPEVVPDEHGVDDLDRLVDFQRFLAPPPQFPRTAHVGEAVFERVGCAECHVPSWTTPDTAPAPLAGVTFRPYSDFLLHDMGALGDGIEDGAAGAREMRTAPLWGLAERRALLHDARVINLGFAGNVNAAIAAHDGQARASAEAFAGASADERAQLIDFLATLGRPHGDIDGDLKVGALDWQLAVREVANAGASLADLDEDGDADLGDLLVLQRSIDG